MEKKVNRLYCIHLWVGLQPKPIFITLRFRGDLIELPAGFSKRTLGLIIGGIWAKSKNEVKQKIAKFEVINWRYQIIIGEIKRVKEINN